MDRSPYSCRLVPLADVFPDWHVGRIFLGPSRKLFLTRLKQSRLSPVRAGCETGLNKHDQQHILSCRSGESSNGFGFVACSDLFAPERHFLSCFWPYHFGSVIAGEFRLSAGYVLQRPRPGNPVTGESRTKPSAVMGQNLPRLRRRHKAGIKADDLAPKHRGWDFLMVDPKQGKPLASTKTQSKTTELNKQYREYLQSEDWRRKRLQRLEIAQHRCAACADSRAVQVHHLTYERIFREEMADLLPLCDFHHDATEDLIKKGKLSRNGDVLFLAAETLRLIVPLKPKKIQASDPQTGFRRSWKMENVFIDSRNLVQDLLMGEARFRVFLFLSCRKKFKAALESFDIPGQNWNSIQNNGCILYDRLQRARARWRKHNYAR